MLYMFLLSMISGTIVLSVNDIFVKKLLKQGIPERLLLVCEYGCAGVIFALIVWLTGLPIIVPAFFGAVLATSTLNILGMFAWYRAFKLSELSYVAPLRLLTPILVVITGFLFLREIPTFGGVLGIFVTVIGLFLLIWKSSLNGNIFSDKGFLWGLLGALSFSLSFPFDKLAVVSSSALMAGAAIYILFTIGTGIMILCIDRVSLTDIALLRKNLKLLAGSIISNVIGSFLVLFALNFALAAYASSLKRLQVLWTVLLSGAFLKEKNIKQKIIATLIMLSGIVITITLG